MKATWKDSGKEMTAQELIREGIHYQEGHNLAVSINGLLNALTQPGAKPADAAPMLAHYYIHNLARLTSLPFIHAVFSAIAGGTMPLVRSGPCMSSMDSIVRMVGCLLAKAPDLKC
jgi:hypothetical protein